MSSGSPAHKSVRPMWQGSVVEETDDGIHQVPNGFPPCVVVRYYDSHLDHWCQFLIFHFGMRFLTVVEVSPLSFHLPTLDYGDIWLVCIYRIHRWHTIVIARIRTNSTLQSQKMTKEDGSNMQDCQPMSLSLTTNGSSLWAELWWATRGAWERVLRYGVERGLAGHKVWALIVESREINMHRSLLS